MKGIIKHFGLEGGFGNIVTSKIVIDKNGKMVYGIDCVGSQILTTDGYEFFVIPLVSVPGTCSLL